jgi:FSR family fosmidomycin resistance protein-like MFS transporter
VVVTAVGLLGLRGMPWLMALGLAASLGLYLLLRDVPDYRPDGATALPWGAALRRMAPVLAPLMGLIGARALVLMAATTFLPTFLTEEGTGLWLAGAALSLLQGAGVAGALLGGSLSDRLGRRWILAFSGVLTPLLLFAFLLSGGWWQFPLLLLLGFVLLSTTPALMAMVQEGYPESRALANGIYMAMGFVGQSVAVMAVGALGDALGLRPAFYVSGAAMLLSLPLIWRLPAKARIA